MVTHTYIHTHIHTHTHTHIHTYTHTHTTTTITLAAHAHRGLMKALKCKPSASFACSYSINILSKYSSLISHRPSMFEGRHIDYRSSKVDTSITDLRRSTRRSSVFEGQHIRKSTHRSSKVDVSEGGNITPTIRRILSTTAPSPWSRRSYTRSYVHV